MNKETSIFSSTGRLGVSRRQYERLYVNGTRFSADSEEVERNFTRLINIGERNKDRIGRSVFRGVVSDNVLKHILRNGLQQSLEVAFPLGEFAGDNSWLIYMANNKPGRERIASQDFMISEVDVQKEGFIKPVDRIKLVIDKGYAFTDQISEDQVDQVHFLWGETFGWDKQEVNNLRQRLNLDRYQDPSRRGVWFSAIRDNGNIVAAAMAERLTILASNGALDLVESTEWKTKAGYEDKGLMTATLAALNAHILSDFQENPNGLPLIFAECNFQSRSDRAGHGAGFRIPDRTSDGQPAPQILVQNVGVNDGQHVPKDKLRDFTFMYLPAKAIQDYYGSVQIDSILKVIKGN